MADQMTPVNNGVLRDDAEKKVKDPNDLTNDNMSGNTMAGETTEFHGDVEKQLTAAGEAKFSRLGWKRLTILLIVEAIALGSLSLPSAFATLGMVAGVILSIGIGLIAIYTSLIVGQVKIKYPGIKDYADIGRLMGGRVGYEIISAMFVLMLVLLVGSHTLTGTIALTTIIDKSVCAVALGVVSAVVLLALAIPPSFTELAWLGYVDFVSIMIAIGITIIATGVQAGNSDGGMSSVDWSAWPKEGLTFSDAFIAVNGIVFAYSFVIALPSFMDEMHTPTDYKKACWTLGIAEIIIYTLTGAIIYAFVGADVESPALLSAGGVISRIAFGVALPVIFISGSINTSVAGRYIHGRVYKNSTIRFINSKMGWITWLALITVITIIAWILAEAIPFFSDLLSLCSSLFISGFSYYLPPLAWYLLVLEGKWYEKKNIWSSLANGSCFVIGIVILVGGTYSSVVDINNQFKDGTVGGSFSCTAP